MSTNISKQKREDLLAKIKEIRTFISTAPQDKNTGNLLTYLSDLEKDVNGKKYGLIFEEHREEIDGFIEKYSRGWKQERISAVSRALMSLCIYEMLFRPDIPIRASLNEAIELVKKYDDEAAKNFVNGILDAVSKEARIARNEE